MRVRKDAGLKAGPSAHGANGHMGQCRSRGPENQPVYRLRDTLVRRNPLASAAAAATPERMGLPHAGRDGLMNR